MNAEFRDTEVVLHGITAKYNKNDEEDMAEITTVIAQEVNNLYEIACELDLDWQDILERGTYS